MAKLPILMYHHVSPDRSEGLTISVDQLRSQFEYLEKEGFTTYHFRELKGLKSMPGGKPVVITFDDVYENQLELAYPLLKEFGLKATFFAPLEFLGKSDTWNRSSHRIMSIEQLHSLDNSVVELGYHSFQHKMYHNCTIDEIREDIRHCLRFTSEKELDFTRVMAYPYGKYPRKSPLKEQFFDCLKDHDFDFGVRIGNRLNRFPFQDPFEIQRIDIKGDYSISKFKRKLRFGKLF